MDDEPRIPKAAWPWIGVILFYLGLGLLALLQGCSASMVADAKADCERHGGVFIAKQGVATDTAGNDYPAVAMLCIYRGKSV